MKYSYVIFLVIVTSFFGCANDSNDNQMAQFKGLWKMYSHEIQIENGKWIDHIWMKEGKGYIIYDGEGHMAVHITPKDYRSKKINWKNEIDSLHQKNYRSKFEIFSSESGDVTLANYVYVSECRILDRNIIEHQRVSHGNPEKFNEIVQRGFEFIGDTLILSPLNLEGQNQRRIKWVKQ